jgi:anthraniloyl-CoA monooxygenase
VRIAVIGGGPGGLYFAGLARRLNPEHEITVWERNTSNDTFGFGVVFSAHTLGEIERADPAVLSEMRRKLCQWDDIDVHYRGGTFTMDGNGFAAMSRAGLLAILQRRCAQLGVALRFSSEIADVDTLAADYDLVVAADGVNSLSRARYAESFRPTVKAGKCRYIWLGSDLRLDSFKFYILPTPGGVIQVHAYPDSRHRSTLILELSENAWRAAGFADAAPAQLAQGDSDERSMEIVAELCKDILRGCKLIGNNSRWLRFLTVRCETWRHRNVVLIGDAAHTAHFSIGSGTKLAMDDAFYLAKSLREQPSVEAALAAYEAKRRPAVLSLQQAAQASQEWFENIDRYTHQDPQQFAVNILTRSRRVSYASLRRRDPDFIAARERWFAGTTGGQASPPMLQPFTLGSQELVNRVVVSPGEPGPVRDGVPGDLQLVRLGSAALGGAGLMLTGPVSASDTGTVAPGGAGLYTEEQEAGWRRVVSFVHANSPTKIGVQLGCYGSDSSTRSLDDLRRQFVAAAQRAAAAGFDLLELDCAQDCLLPSLSSSAGAGRNRGRLRSWLRYPLEVFGAIRAAWPAERPMSVRVSPADWHSDEDGTDAVAEVANEFAVRGAAAVHVRAGTQTDASAYADRIRNQAGCKSELAVIAAGAISAPDINPIILAGRADLCVVDQQADDPPWFLPRVIPAHSA